MITERLIFLTAFMAGAGALAFGAHTAVGVWTAPASADLTIPALPPSEPPQQPTQPPGRAPLSDLAPLFGTTPETEPQDAFPDEPPVDELFEGEPVLDDDLPYFDDYAFQLRGLLVDETGAMAILDTPEGTQIVREGSILESGEEVLAITEDGLELEFQGEVYLISFDDLDDPLGDDF